MWPCSDEHLQSVGGTCYLNYAILQKSAMLELNVDTYSFIHSFIHVLFSK